MGKNVLECKKIYKSYLKKEFIKDVSFSMKEGDILGFIGPNGARKNNYYKDHFGALQNK